MTETEMKLNDAQVQIDLIRTHIDDETIVRSCINSFISLARSVTLVMQSESGDKSTTLHVWYDAMMESMIENEGHKKLLDFFNDRRVYSVHKGTIQPQSTKFAILAPYYKDGNAIMRSSYATDWIFDKTGEYKLYQSESAVGLCEKYLELLKKLVVLWVEERSKLELKGTH